MNYEWLTTTIGWTILHAVWQIGLMGSIWFLILRGLKKESTATKYQVSIFSMLLIFVVSGVTFFSILKNTYPREIISIENNSTRPTTTSEITEVASFPVSNAVERPAINPQVDDSKGEMYFEDWLSPTVLNYFVMIWLGGVLLFGGRFLIHYLGMRRLSRVGTIPFEKEQLVFFKQLKMRMKIKRVVTFLQSELVTSPMTFGHLKPVVLLPLGMINGFPPEQVEAILLHELAHIRRHDFLVNMVQAWLEILFFYHPIVWIISKKMRQMREELCDDEAIWYMQKAKTVSDTSDTNVVYAEALINLQKYFLHNKNKLAMNATGQKSGLSQRIHRLFDTQQNPPQKKGNMNSRVLGLVLLIALGSFAFSNFSQATVSVAVDKMNVVYIGVDNPLTVAVAGVANEDVKVESETLKLTSQGEGHYIANATKPGTAIVKVSARGHGTEEIKLRVKRVPDPVAKVGKSAGGTMAVENIKTMAGVHATLDYFDFDASCVIKSFIMTVVPKGGEPIESINSGADFTEVSRKLLLDLKPEDIIYFDNVRCRCPGDSAARMINSMVFKMK